MKFFKIAILVISIVLPAVFYHETSFSAVSNPEIVMTWKANSFIPHWYKGKAMPIRNSEIKAGLLLTDNGKVVDLSRYEIRWIGDNGIFEKGIGLVNLSFKLNKLISEPQNLTATVVGYNGQNIKKTMSIPVVVPEISVDTNLNSSLVKDGGLALLRAVPLFFNINKESDINVKWNLNNKSLASESADGLIELNVPKFGMEAFTIDLTANNKLQELEIASTEKYFNIIK